MPRNINRRVEVLFPVQDARIIRYLRDSVLGTYLESNVKTRILRPDGAYEYIQAAPGDETLSVQEWLLKHHQRT